PIEPTRHWLDVWRFHGLQFRESACGTSLTRRLKSGRLSPGTSRFSYERRLKPVYSAPAIRRQESSIHYLMAIFHIRHATTYRYARQVAFGEHRLMFRPRDSFDQRLLAAKLRVKPQPHNVHWIHDVFGNCIAIVDIAECAKELCFETSIRVDHTPHAPLDLRMDDEAQTYPFAYDPEELPDVAPMMAQP